MGVPLNISQFNALLHSRKDQPELISALRELTSVDMVVFGDPTILRWYW
jgi:hypothetical protein